MITTIQVDTKLKTKLDKLKSHHRETYNEVLNKLIKNMSEVDTEGLKETVEIMSDPETMKNIAEAVMQINQGNYGTPLKEVEKELGLD